MARQEIETLRKLMKEKGVSICLVPTADAHESEYPGEHFMARRYLSGFTGSAGTLAVSGDWAGLWTDARYFLQAETQLKNSGITLYRSGEAGVPLLEEEIGERLPKGGVLAYDGAVVNRRMGTALRKEAEKKGAHVLLEDLPGQIWEDRPPLSAAKQLENIRREQEHYLEPSFTTIAAYGANGAIVHYSATEESDTELKPEGFFLVDSGGQYLEGTTDITRTIVLGDLTENQKTHFTAVLRGMLALGDAHFLHGCRGINLDYLAREPLWTMGLDYKHGTGHGVGFLLNVHESPNSFRWQSGPGKAESAVLEAGMVTSDEPGLYLAGEYGIRTENLLLCKNGEKTEYGQFLEFEFLTMVPVDLEGIDWSQMTEADIRRLDQYHKKVYETLSPYFKGDELEWLKEATGQSSQYLQKIKENSGITC